MPTYEDLVDAELRKVRELLIRTLIDPQDIEGVFLLGIDQLHAHWGQGAGAGTPH